MDLYLRAPGDGHVIGFTWPIHPTIERQWRDGTLSRVNADGTPYEDGDEYAVLTAAPDDEAADGTEPEPDEPEVIEPVRPVANAPKAAWVAFAVALGAVSDAEAAAMTKADLVKVCTPPEMAAPDPGE